MDEEIHDGDQYNFSSDATNTISFSDGLSGAKQNKTFELHRFVHVVTCTKENILEYLSYHYIFP